MTKRVFFLGAGFSKAIDEHYPLMWQLTENIETEIGNTKYPLRNIIEK